MNKEKLERVALKSTIWGSGIMALLGLGFGWFSNSNAILLDGVFSLLGVVMAIATLNVSRLIRQPDDERFHFGYAHFAPMVNVIKAGLVVLLCVFALVSAVADLLGDGRNMVLGQALIYAVMAALLGIGFAVFLHIAAKKTGSALVKLDATNMFIDALLSGAVLISFSVGWMLQGTTFDPWLVYLDPAVVGLLCLAALPGPLKLLWQNAREVLLFAPVGDIQSQVMERISAAVADLPVAGHKVRMLKMGNVLTVLLHLQPDDPDMSVRFSELDDIRRRVAESLGDLEDRVHIDVVFVGDLALAN